jgi:hypothetical protein
MPEMHCRSPVILVSVVALASCSHVIHPAAVKPGLSYGLGAGPKIERHAPRPESSGASTSELGAFDPYSTLGLSALLNLGWGWRFSDDRAAQVMVTGGTDSLPTLAGYYQLLGSGIDAGIGGYVSAISPGAYALVGREIRIKENAGVRLDAGARLEKIFGRGADVFSYGPQFLLGLSFSHLELGIWGDYTRYSTPIFTSLCGDSCGKDELVDRKMTLGLLFTHRFAPR